MDLEIVVTTLLKAIAWAAFYAELGLLGYAVNEWSLGGWAD